MAQRPIVHIEISAKDREKAGEFYEKLFGWQIKQMPDMNYATFDPGSVPGGGFNPVTEDNPAGKIVIYVYSDDIDSDLEKVKKLGGKVALEKMVVPDVGWIAIFEDPTGNHIGLHTPMRPV
jgi:uncharacterized protein